MSLMTNKAVRGGTENCHFLFPESALISRYELNLQIPECSCMGPNENHSAIARNDQAGGAASIIKARTLIVDDESAERQHLHELLAGRPEIELLGECADGHEALAAIQEKSPDLLLLDIKMP